MYYIGIDPNNKELNISFNFFQHTDEVTTFVEDYHSKIVKINPKEYTLILDGSDFTASSTEMLQILDEILKMYLENDFKKIYVVRKNSSTMEQIEHTNNDYFMGKVTIVNDLDEIS